MRGRDIIALLRSTEARIVLGLVVVLLGAAGIVSLTDENGDGATDTITITIPQRGHAAIVEADRDQQRDASDLRAENDKTLKTGTPEVHEDTRDEIVPGVDANDVERAQETARGVGTPQRLGGAQNYSCPAHYVRNQSALNGRRSGVALHFTVSAPGSLNAIRNLFNTPSFGASSTFGIELSGRCETWVPPNRKSWAQGAFNSAYESVEIVTFDRTRAQWLGSPILKRGILASLTADRLKARGAPPRLVNPVGCTPRAGYTDHERLECGNVHWDVGKRFPWDTFGQQVVRAYYGGNPVKPAPRPIAARWHSRCRRLNETRDKIKARQHVSTAERDKAHDLRVALTRGRYSCSSSRPSRAVRS